MFCSAYCLYTVTPETIREVFWWANLSECLGDLWVKFRTSNCRCFSSFEASYIYCKSITWVLLRKKILMCFCFFFVFHQPRHAEKLLSVLKYMAHRTGPDSFFSFPGKNAAVSTPHNTTAALTLCLPWLHITVKNWNAFVLLLIYYNVNNCIVNVCLIKFDDS